MQCADTVLMVRPACFYADPQTVATNAFQQVTDEDPAALLQLAQAEFDAAVTVLRGAGLGVLTIDAPAHADTPDALYPNNWFSTHTDGTLVLYPMASVNRRRERLPDIATYLTKDTRRVIRRTVDLTALEAESLYVEGTGSLVIDHDAKLAYAALSSRTDQVAVEQVCMLLDLQPILFHAYDEKRQAIYHTNVLMALGETLAIVASDLIAAQDRSRVLEALAGSGKVLLEISPSQVAQFAGNGLFLRSTQGDPLLALSARAWRSFSKPQQALIQAHATPVLPDVLTIERVGGGGIRCMLAEVFLPRADSPE
jgi:hypothetical protein